MTYFSQFTLLIALAISTASQAQTAKLPDRSTEITRVQASVERFVQAHSPAADWARLKVEDGIGSDSHSATAEADWGSKTCPIHIDPARVVDHWGTADGRTSSLEFVALHELSHCLLYATQRLGWRDAGYKGDAPEGLLDEIWAMDAVSPAQGEDRINWFGLGHEAFADSLAVAWLMESSGADKSAFGNVSALRDGTPMDRGHDVGSASKWIADGGWQTQGWNHDRAARAAAARLLLSMPGFEPLTHLPLPRMADLIARHWCVWSRGADAEKFSKTGENFWLGKTAQPADGNGSTWATPLPALSMPAFAMTLVRPYTKGDVENPDESACVAAGIEVLAARFGPALRPVLPTSPALLTLR